MMWKLYDEDEEDKMQGAQILVASTPALLLT